MFLRLVIITKDFIQHFSHATEINGNNIYTIGILTKQKYTEIYSVYFVYSVYLIYLKELLNHWKHYFLMTFIWNRHLTEILLMKSVDETLAKREAVSWKNLFGFLSLNWLMKANSLSNTLSTCFPLNCGLIYGCH